MRCRAGEVAGGSRIDRGQRKREPGQLLPARLTDRRGRVGRPCQRGDAEVAFAEQQVGLAEPELSVAARRRAAAAVCERDRLVRGRECVVAPAGLTGGAGEPSEALRELRVGNASALPFDGVAEQLERELVVTGVLGDTCPEVERHPLAACVLRALRPRDGIEREGIRSLHVVVVERELGEVEERVEGDLVVVVDAPQLVDAVLQPLLDTFFPPDEEAEDSREDLDVRRELAGQVGGQRLEPLEPFRALAERSGVKEELSQLDERRRGFRRATREQPVEGSPHVREIVGSEIPRRNCAYRRLRAGRGRRRHRLAPTTCAPRSREPSRAGGSAGRSPRPAAPTRGWLRSTGRGHRARRHPTRSRVIARHGFQRFERTTVHERASAREHVLLIGRQQVETPLERRVERPVPVGCVAVRPSERGEVGSDPACERLRRQGPQARA